MVRRKSTIAAPKSGKGIRPSRKHLVEEDTSNDDNAGSYGSKRSKLEFIEKGRGSLIQMFPPPYRCYENRPSPYYCMSLPPRCPILDEVTVPTAVIGMTTNELWLKRDDMFYNMDHEALSLCADTKSLYRLTNLQGRTMKPEDCQFLPQYANHLQRLNLALTLTNDYVKQLEQQRDQMRTDMKSWRAERREWEARHAANGMRTSILERLVQVEKEKEAQGYFPDDFAGYHPDHTEENPKFLHVFHHKNENGSMSSHLHDKLVVANASSHKIQSAVLAEEDRLEVAACILRTAVPLVKRKEQSRLQRTTPNAQALQGHVAEDEDFLGAFDPPLPPMSETCWNLDEDNPILHRELFLKWVMGRYMMWKPKVLKIASAEDCREFFRLPSMPIPSPWPSSIRELKLPSPTCWRDHKPWQFPAFVLLAFLKKRSKANKLVTINALFVKETLRVLREMEIAWQNMDASSRWFRLKNNDTKMDWVPETAVTLLNALYPSDNVHEPESESDF
ncbi:hypothetical protein CBS147346_3602 [Aspergillus niger]|nr:hypothetical protein CBS147346_3602 [Aspergillus niger]